MYKSILILSLLLLPAWLRAETAEDYFHRGAQFYIWGQKQKATNEIFTGLRLFPADGQLNALAGLLKKEKEEESKKSQQNQNGQQSDQAKEDQNQQQQQAQQNQSGQKQDSAQQNQQQQQTNQQQQASDQSQQPQQPPPSPDHQQTNQTAAAQQKQDSDEKERESAQAYASGQMTPDQARQLLDAEKGQEQMLPVKPEGKPFDPSKPFRDW